MSDKDREEVAAPHDSRHDDSAADDEARANSARDLKRKQQEDAEFLARPSIGFERSSRWKRVRRRLKSLFRR